MSAAILTLILLVAAASFVAGCFCASAAVVGERKFCSRGETERALSDPERRRMRSAGPPSANDVCPCNRVV